ncbi:MAG: flagellar brake protein [Acidobacteriota bacterium]
MMISILPLVVQDPIIVRVTDSPASPCASLVEGVETDRLLIRWPTASGKRMSIAAGRILTVCFCRGGRAFEFQARVLETSEGPLPLVAIRPSTSPRSVQRREDVRVQTLARVELAPRVVELARFKGPGHSSPTIKGEANSISAGGFSVSVPMPIPVGTLFHASLSLHGERGSPLRVTAKVVRCKPVESHEAAPQAFEVGFAYANLAEAVRKRIVRFVFGAQREQVEEEE